MHFGPANRKWRGLYGQIRFWKNMERILGQLLKFRSSTHKLNEVVDQSNIFVNEIKA